MYKLLITLTIFFSLSSLIAAPIGFVANTEGDITTKSGITPDGRFYYTTELDGANGYNIYAYSRNKETGELTLIQQMFGDEIMQGISGLNFHPNALIVSPDGKQLYISGNFGSNQASSLPFRNSIIHFNVLATGLIEYQGRLPDVADDAMVITPNGRFIISGTQNRLNVISRGQNGVINYIAEIRKDRFGNSLRYPGALSISPDGNTVYASSHLGQGHLYTFNLNQSTGVLTNRQAFFGTGHEASGTHAGEVEIDGQGGISSLVTKDGKFYYAVGGTRHGTAKGAISIFRRGTDGALSFFKNVASAGDVEVNNVQKILFSAKQFITISPDQKFIYVGDRIKKNIGVWRRNGSTGDLNYIGLVELDKHPANSDGASRGVWGSLMAPDGRHLYIATGKGTTVFDLRTDLSIVKTGSQSVEASGVISYTLAVTNDGPSDAQNVVITDALPAGASYISGTVNSPTGGCSASGLTVKCNLGSMFVNDGFNAVIKVRAPSNTGAITNTASVKADQLDTNTSNSTDQMTTTVTIGSGNGGNDDSGNGGNDSDDTGNDDDSGSSGGSIPFEVILLLILPSLLRRRKIVS